MAIHKSDLDQIRPFVKSRYIEDYIRYYPNDERLKFGRNKLHLICHLCNLFTNDTYLKNYLINLATYLLKEETFPRTYDDFGKSPGDYLNGAPWGSYHPEEIKDSTVSERLRDKICGVKKEILDAKNNFERDQEEIGVYGFDIIQELISNLENTVPIMEETLEYIKDDTIS